MKYFTGRHFQVCSNFILLVYLEMGGLLFDYWYDNKSQLFYLDYLTHSKKIAFIYVFFAH